MQLSRVLIVALSVGLSGCASLFNKVTSSNGPSNGSTKPRGEETRLRAYDRNQRLKQSQLEWQRERQMVLEEKKRTQMHQQHVDDFEPQSITELEPAPQSITELASAPVQSQKISQVSKSAPASSDETSQTGEQLLYSKVLESYRRHNSEELQKTLQILLKTYPDSIFADNAVYMAGLLAFESGDLNRAQLFMDRVLRDYPRGNKAVSALFAKAMIQKKSSKLMDAKRVLISLQQIYPGSPEAARAEIEIKMVNMMAAKKNSQGERL